MLAGIASVLLLPRAAFAATQDVCPRVFPWSESGCDGFFNEVIIGHPLLSIPIFMLVFGTLVAIATMLDPKGRAMQVMRGFLVTLLSFPLAIMFRVFVWGAIISLYSLTDIPEAPLISSMMVWALVWFAAAMLIFRLVDAVTEVSDAKTPSGSTAWLYAHAASGGFLFWIFLATEGW